MAKRFHINPDTGKPGVCNPEKTGICKYGSDAPHFSSEGEAYQAYEKQMEGEAFTVLVKQDKTPAAAGGESRTVQVFDNNLEANITRFEEDYAASTDKANWVNGKVDAFESTKTAIMRTLPGTPEREAALASRVSARADLLAADLVVWRNSDFYNESVEDRMKANTVAVTDADQSIERALADSRGISEAASANGLSPRDVENILEVAHQDYLRPRGGLSKSLSELSNSDSYTETTAYVFRVEPSAVKGVLSYASEYSAMKASA